MQAGKPQIEGRAVLAEDLGVELGTAGEVPQRQQHVAFVIPEAEGREQLSMRAVDQRHRPQHDGCAGDPTLDEGWRCGLVPLGHAYRLRHHGGNSTVRTNKALQNSAPSRWCHPHWS